MELDNILFNQTPIPFEDRIETSKTRIHKIKAKALLSGNKLIWLRTGDRTVVLSQLRHDEEIGKMFKIHDKEKVYHAYLDDKETNEKNLVILLEDGSIACMPNSHISHIDEWAYYKKGVEPNWKGHRFNV